MSSILKAIRTNDRIVKERGWDRSYWFIDIHGTMIKPNYSKEKIPTEFYPFAIDVLKILTNRPEIKLCLYTCSWPEEIEKYIELFTSHGIKFDYINGNPEVSSSSYGCFDKKPYINVLMDDKSGFDPNEDWFILRRHFVAKYSLSPGWAFINRMKSFFTNLLKNKK